eukprot:scaffold26888_cov137-Cylindrotheca_fusiformis.AAC.2
MSDAFDSLYGKKKKPILMIWEYPAASTTLGNTTRWTLEMAIIIDKIRDSDDDNNSDDPSQPTLLQQHYELVKSIARSPQTSVWKSYIALSRAKSLLFDKDQIRCANMLRLFLAASFSNPTSVRRFSRSHQH